MELPSYYQDPYYKQSQEFLFPFYSSLLEGKPNEYYAPIGEYGGKALEDIIGLSTRDITKSASESLLRSGLSRSGIATDVISKAVGDVSTKLRWDDYNRALQGRLNLLGVGSTGMSGVRSAGLQSQGLQNQFNLSVAGLESEQEASMWGNILSSVIGTAGGIYGMGQLSDILKDTSTVAPKKVTSDIGSIDFSNFNYSNWLKLIK